MYLLQVIFLFLPAGIANLVPPFAVLLLPKFNQPLDFHQSFRGHRIFGDHKTIRGLIVGIIFAGITFELQKYLYLSFDHIRSFSLIDYSNFTILFGFAQGLGALGGDAIKSFFKRQINIKPGTSWFPFDQIDWVLGSLFISFIFIPVSISLFASYLVAGLALHLLFKSIGFLIKMNQSYI